MTPAGPPPAMQHRTEIFCMGPLNDCRLILPPDQAMPTLAEARQIPHCGVI
jgi:hypothetical protein